MQSVRANHSGPDEKHSTNSRRKVTRLFQFQCYVILQRVHQGCCKNRNKQRYQSYDEPKVMTGHKAECPKSGGLFITQVHSVAVHVLHGKSLSMAC